MNLLQLVQRAMQEGGASGTITTTAGQIGEAQRFVNWVQSAWSDLQTIHDDWNWMRSSYILGSAGDSAQGTGLSFNTVAGQAVYQIGTGAGQTGIDPAKFQKWVRGSFFIYPTAAGYVAETQLDLIDFDAWRYTYMLGANRNVQTRPVAVAEGPDFSICLGPPPAAGYTVTGDYYTAPNQMVEDINTPTGLPPAQHMIIVWKALLDYGGYEAASDVYQRADAHYQSMMSQLESLRLPEVGWSGALA
jgi:hypothetical protein